MEQSDWLILVISPLNVLSCIVQVLFQWHFELFYAFATTGW